MTLLQIGKRPAEPLVRVSAFRVVGPAFFAVTTGVRVTDATITLG